ncbi:MAG: hypothetical protein ACK41Q_13405 [Candidatus Brocadia sp.]
MKRTQIYIDEKMYNYLENESKPNLSKMAINCKNGEIIQRK